MKEGLYIDKLGRLLELICDTNSDICEFEIVGVMEHIIFGNYFIYKTKHYD